MLGEKDYLEATRYFKNKIKNPHERQRYHALILLTKGYSYRETADILLVNEQTISRWVDLYRAEGLEGLRNHPHWGGENGQSLKTDVALQQVLEQLLDNDMAGDPMSEQRWVHCSGAQLAAKLKQAGYSVCPTTCPSGWHA